MSAPGAASGQSVSDDPSIPDDAELWRRIPYWHWHPDPSVPAGHRPSSAAFDDPELSVVIAAECPGGMDAILVGHEGFGVASFTAGEARRFGWGVVRVPLAESPAHAHVTGRKTGGQRSELAKACRMLKDPKRA
jgi:hypothetical protein